MDKTAIIYNLLKVNKGQFFLSRPRRFGKSLLISTFKAIFQGKRELFKGLAIDSLDYDWKTYPVIHLDMGSAQAATVEEFKSNLHSMLSRIERNYGLTTGGGDETVSSHFMNLVNALAETSPEGRVVILVDEYDKPLLGHLGKSEALGFRDLLKNFYSVIKTTESMQRFAFITGVSNFSKVSIFSDLNNLTDLTMRTQAATLLGYTKEELLKYFPEYIDRLAEAEGKSFDETVAKLTLWYDGYKFHPSAEKIFNPVSVGNCFNDLKFKNYWFETATPTFLIDMLKKNAVDLSKLTAREKDFSTYEVESPSVVALLVQTGYLTITSSEKYSDAERLYRLDFPNLEVRYSFNDYLLAGFANIGNYEETQYLDLFADAVREGDIDAMLETARCFFANIPNTIALKHEKYYQTIFYSLFTVIGVRVKTEVATNIGRIDAVIENAQTIFVMEFKLHDTAEAALDQIKAKKYYEKYLLSGKEIKLVGVAFDEETRNIAKWVVETL